MDSIAQTCTSAEALQCGKRLLFVKRFALALPATAKAAHTEHAQPASSNKAKKTELGCGVKRLAAQARRLQLWQLASTVLRQHCGKGLHDLLVAECLSLSDAAALCVLACSRDVQRPEGAAELA